MAHFEKQLDSQTMFTGRVFTITLDTVELENGGTSTREIVHHHGGACILPLTDEGEVYMVRQFRYALGQEMWELPAGKLEQNEDPKEAARRELGEECGLTADCITDLFPVYPSVGYDSEVIHCYLATGLHPCEMHLDEDEFLTPFKMPLEEACRLVMDGTIRDSKTAVCLLKAWRLKQEGKL